MKKKKKGFAFDAISLRPCGESSKKVSPNFYIINFTRIFLLLTTTFLKFSNLKSDYPGTDFDLTYATTGDIAQPDGRKYVWTVLIQVESYL